MGKSNPTIVIAGTPGTGKSSMCEIISEKAGLKHINISEFAKVRNLVEEYDEEFDSYVLDEDKVIEELLEELTEGGVLIDYHSGDLFPAEHVDIVFVLRTDNTVLYDRLQARGYSENKVQKNVECEIMQGIVEDCREWFSKEQVHELQNDTVQQQDENVKNILAWIENYRNDNR